MAGVMIVEDDAALREMLRDSLEKRKYTVITACRREGSTGQIPSLGG
ncbi:MAG: response regulator [Marinilabiliales bacterium]|nr:response regulator [Marinilabiliales bacterium]